MARLTNKQKKIKAWSQSYGRKITEEEYKGMNQIFTERKAGIKSLIDSGALKNLATVFERCYKKRKRNYILNEYAEIIRSNVESVKALDKKRGEQRDYLNVLASDIKRLGRIKTGGNNVTGLLNQSRVKQHIAKHHSNFRLVKKTKYSDYWLVFYLNELFGFPQIKYAEKIELISSIIVFYELSSAICRKAEGKKYFFKYYPATIKNSVVRIDRISIPVKKIKLHKQCRHFEKADNSCSYAECVRESQNVQQRLKRSPGLFAGMLAGNEFREYKEKKLLDLAEARKQNNFKETIPAGMSSARYFEGKIRSGFIYEKFSALIAQQCAYTDIYIDDLAGILRENGIAGLNAFEFYKALNKDRKFLDTFKVRFHLSDTKGDIKAAFKTAIASSAHAH